MKYFVLCLLFHASLSDISSQKVNLLIVFAGWYLANVDAFLAAQTAAECTLYFFHIFPLACSMPGRDVFFTKLSLLLLNNVKIFNSTANTGEAFAPAA